MFGLPDMGNAAAREKHEPFQGRAIGCCDEDGPLRPRRKRRDLHALDTESGFRDVFFVTAAYGLGENTVQGGAQRHRSDGAPRP